VLAEGVMGELGRQLGAWALRRQDRGIGEALWWFLGMVDCGSVCSGSV